jgi:uncharacterized protein YbjT (DUF2867 family)
MENLVTPWFLNGDKLCTAMDPRTSLQMIAVEDIGKYGALAFTEARGLNGQAIDIAGDALTMPDAAATLSKALGRKIEFVRLPIEEIRKNGDDFALMLEWFDTTGYDADIKGNAKKYGIKPTTLPAWAAKLPRG